MTVDVLKYAVIYTQFHLLLIRSDEYCFILNNKTPFSSENVKQIKAQCEHISGRSDLTELDNLQ